jgi:hypothetical protein
VGGHPFFLFSLFFLSFLSSYRLPQPLHTSDRLAPIHIRHPKMVISDQPFTRIHKQSRNTYLKEDKKKKKKRKVEQRQVREERV